MQREKMPIRFRVEAWNGCFNVDRRQRSPRASPTERSRRFRAVRRHTIGFTLGGVGVRANPLFPVTGVVGCLRLALH